MIERNAEESCPLFLVDSEYSKNTDDRRSITSGLHTVEATLVDWKSMTKHIVALSSMEAE